MNKRTQRTRKTGLTRRERTILFAESKPNHPAARLSEALARADVPVKTAAPVVGVSPYSIYLWLAGDVEPSPGKVTIIRRLTAALDSATDAGDLPLMGRPGDVVEILRRHL